MDIQYIFGNPRAKAKRKKKALASKGKSRKNKMVAKTKGKTMAKRKKLVKRKIAKKRNPKYYVIKSKGTVVGAKGIVKKGLLGRTKSILTDSEYSKLKSDYRKNKEILSQLRKGFSAAKGDAKKRSELLKKINLHAKQNKMLIRAARKNKKNMFSARKTVVQAAAHGKDVQVKVKDQSLEQFLGEGKKMAKKKKAKKASKKKAKVHKKKKAKKVSKKAKKAKVHKKKKAKVHKKAARKSSKKRRLTKASAKAQSRGKVLYKMSTVEPKKKKKKSKKVKYKIRGKKRTILMSLKRLNPFGGNMKVNIKDFTGLEVKEAGYLVAGSVGSDLVEKLSRKYLGAYISQLDSMVPGGVKAVNALVVGAAAALTHKYVKNDHAKEVAKAVIVAQIVKLGSSLTEMVAKPLGLSGVDYTPLSGIPYGLRGVDYTPLSGATPQMGSVNFTKSLNGPTPQMGYGADFGRGYDVSDYGGGGGYTEDRKFSSADFGNADMDDSDDEPILDQSGSLV